jgi:hypothetical protein
VKNRKIVKKLFKKNDREEKVWRGQRKIEQDRTEQSRAEQSRDEESRTE